MRTSKCTTWVWAALVLALAGCGIGSARAQEAAGQETLAILPAQFTLTGPQARQRLLLDVQRGGASVGQVTADVTWTSSDPNVVKVEESTAIPVGNGTATITAQAGQRTVSVPVTVTAMDRPFVWSFRHHVESVLTKVGCNSGACHGAALGKKGFRLTLRGYDVHADFNTITRQARGRRMVPSDPGRSLLLLKPTAAVPHAGGRRFEVGSLEYRVIAEWIAAGTPPPADGDPQLQRLEVLPPRSVLKPGDTQQLMVRAHFSDGRAEDVTRWVKYTSTNEAVAQVDDGGAARVVGHGEGAITAWYLSQVVTATISSPFPNQVDPAVFASAPRRNFIDELVLAKLQSLNIAPSPPASDGAFLRRAFLDTIGTLPTAEEARAFLADASPDKRDQLIAQLLSRPEFVDYWAYKWSDLLLVNSERLKPPAMWAFYNWVRNHVAANTPWDKIVAELLTAKGSTFENGAANFFVLHQDPFDMAETSTQAFLGLSIGCAKCHNHPMEKWTNSQYYAMANLFGRVRAKDGAVEGLRTIYDAAEGDVIQPLSGRALPPQPLDGQALPLDAPGRREHLARWLTSPDNPFFRRAIANRVWANFMGVGLVEAVDDLRLSNPASNEALLNALADDLVKNHFDLKALMQLILQSQTYQRSSQPLPENKADERFYSRYYPRRLMAEVLLDAISQVSGVPTPFPEYPQKWRAIQLPDANVPSYFLKSFGRPDRVITCECERTSQPSMVQVLHISNGDTINDKLAAKGNRIEKLLESSTSDEKVIDELFLAALARFPADDERSKLLAELQGTPPSERRQVIEDLYWSVLSSKEFLFNH